ncbi:unnamed protein product [Cladocopium goreaui]|uniref:Uncharacterized protein n=1 Tax=Cladocopium goreaui TaxID=2562237 RepID=A0A9P1C671_9DINO|nr:unnamed protein product [Cladocopium goreaui]
MPAPFRTASAIQKGRVAVQTSSVHHEAEEDSPDKHEALRVFRAKRTVTGRSWEALLNSQRALGDGLRHIFAGKATGTLHARASPILRYVMWCDKKGNLAFPLVAYLRKRRTLQKDPLSVAMVEHLEKVVMAERTPLGAGEGADWLRQLLQVSGIPSGSMGNIGTHSLKATTLSWMAKFGAPISIRQHLGYHMPSADKMALLYSRDASAGPIRKLEECLAEIRAKSFLPDATRSGYFPMQAQRPDPDVEQGLSGRGSNGHDWVSGHTIGGVMSNDNKFEYFSCAVPERLVEEWGSMFSHFIGLVEMYAILVSRRQATCPLTGVPLVDL